MFQIYTIFITFSFLVLNIYAESADWKSLADHKSWEILDKFDCGESLADRIIGGKNAALGQFPWIARLGYKQLYSLKYIDYKCGAVLITNRHILTAAHCAAEPSLSVNSLKLAKVRVGEHDIRTNPDCVLGVCAPPVQDLDVERVIIHEKFQYPASDNDIAMIVLKEPIAIEDNVLPICLPKKDQFIKLKEQELVSVAGWGIMNMTTEERADVLQTVQLPIVQNKVCADFGYEVSESQICAGAQEGKDSCNGDSGGPLMKVYDTGNGPKTFVMGVVSYGANICGSEAPGVYSSVPYYLRWILDNIS